MLNSKLSSNNSNNRDSLVGEDKGEQSDVCSYLRRKKNLNCCGLKFLSGSEVSEIICYSFGILVIY